MTALYEQWQENKDRPSWVRSNRQTLEARADVEEPIPMSLPAVDTWLNKYSKTVTKQLSDTDDGDKNNNDSVAEGGDN